MIQKIIKTMFIFGTRPEAIKLIPVIKILKANKNFLIKICVTAQHRELLDSILNIFSITPNYDLNIMQDSQSILYITNKILVKLDKILKDQKPDIILVHGDTTTTFASALCAFYNKIRIGHIEAGLRSFNKYEPFPEEINRKLVTQLADLHFAPTLLAKKNLLKENINQKNIFVTGNTAIDCINLTLEKNYVFKNKVLKNLGKDSSKKIILVTAHRRENWGEPLKNICRAILKLSQNNQNLVFIYILHPNPTIKKIAQDILLSKPNIYLLDPLDIKDMHNLISKSFLVITDSGGLQEEVPSFNKPVLVLRNITERPEGINSGVLKLIGTDFNNIIYQTQDLINNKSKYDFMSKAINPFGDGKASQRISNALLYYFGLETLGPQFNF